MDRSKRGESGAQLLARLSARPDLSSIDPDVFGSAYSSKRHSTVKLASCGQIIEIYGSEGVGKTEIALHYIAKACLPCQWKNVCIDGIGAKVIVIDTNFKFSVLRLAIVLEKQILSLIENLKNCRNGQCVVTHSKNQTCPLQSTKSNIRHEEGTISNLAAAQNVISTRTVKENESTFKEISRNVKAEMRKGDNKSGNDMLGDEEWCHELGSDSQVGCETGQQKDTSASHDILTPQEVEELVQEALGRVQVLRVHSSEQLLASLLSLEMTLSCDPQIAMVVIDTISSFYWTDKLADQDNSQATEMRMSPIANTLSKYISDFALTFVAIKSALIAGKRNWEEDRENLWKKLDRSSGDTNGQNALSKSSRRDIATCEHVEFLGKSWNSLPIRRLVITKSCDLLGRTERVMWCSEWSSGKPFMFSDDSLHFV